jgi:hypothetical protein
VTSPGPKLNTYSILPASDKHGQPKRARTPRCLPNDHAFSGGAQAPSAATRS